MKDYKSTFLKVSILALFLIISIGAVSAADDANFDIKIHDSDLNVIDQSTDFDDADDLDEISDDDSDLEDENPDDDFDDDSDLEDENPDDDFDEDDSDLDDEDFDEDDSDLDDEDWDDEDFDWDDEDWDDFGYSDFEYLRDAIESYLLKFGTYPDDDFDWDEDYGLDDEDWDDDSDDEDLDDEYLDDEDWDDDSDDEDLDDEYLDDDSDDEDLDDEDWEDEDWDEDLDDEEYLEWYETEEFLNELQSFNSQDLSKYLNESDVNYEIYSKIYNSIVSTFDDYNLTDNETEYLKFFILYYLNHYGDCTDYEWNESDEFANFLKTEYLVCMVKGAYFSTTSCSGESLGAHAPDANAPGGHDSGAYFPNAYAAGAYGAANYFSAPEGSADTNSTGNNSTHIESTSPELYAGDSEDYSWILLLVLMIFAIIFVI